jgi:hypothetical protein
VIRNCRIGVRLSHYFEVSHLPAGMVLDDMAVIQRFAGTIVCNPRDAYAAAGWDVDCVLSRKKVRRSSIHLEHLEEEAVLAR